MPKKFFRTSYRGMHLNHIAHIALFYIAEFERKPSLRRAQVAVSYLPDTEMRQLARRFLGERKKDIDVLAFPDEVHFPHPEARGGRVLGDIYLREGLKRKPLPLRGFFVIHGLLHLLGYTHDKKRDTMIMEDRERLLFKKIFPHIPHPWPRTTTATAARAPKKAKRR